MSTRQSLSHRVFSTIFVVAIIAILLFMIAGTAYLQSNLIESTRRELIEETDVVAAALEQTTGDKAFFDEVDLDDSRLTLLSSDGTVLYDNVEDPEDMGNHADRPEIRAASLYGTGSAERSSTTVGETMVYEAVRLSDGRIIRLAKPQESYVAIFARLLVPLLALGVVAAIVAWFAARRESRAIIAPLLLVDLDHPKDNLEHAYAEMVPMLERIENQRQELKRQMRVLADNDRMRREFTANITHELKTPLTAISGYAELIASGMVEDEADKQDFAHRIHMEAGRLTSLVNDILTLSNLDEAEHSDDAGALETLGSREPVDMARLIDSIYQRLEGVAAASDVTLSTSCDPVVIEGVPRLLDGLVYNLVSNAIRYNRPRGSVEVGCGLDGGVPFVRVSDTGIGIAKDEQDKVFERFYRVDKSRSKMRGGTGLGLAIVKHAALFHGASIKVESELGEGTTITVRFPGPFDGAAA